MESLKYKFNFEQEFEHLFRHAYGRIVSALSSKYSPTLIDQIEDSVQESLLKAMQIWGYKGLPKDPAAWLYRVANNHLIDQLRRVKKGFNSNDFEQTAGSYEYQSQDFEYDIQDDQLRMIFACCHPSLEITEQIMLSLKILGGLSVKEIAHAFMKKEARDWQRDDPETFGHIWKGDYINLVIDIADIVEVIEAFRGIPHRFRPTSPDPCTSLCP